MKTRLLTLGLAAAFAAAPAAMAETLLIPLGNQGGAVERELPGRGTLKAEVRRRLGEPLQVSPPVGDPPISSWEYDDFRVYFEYNHVVHAVKKHRPRHPEASEDQR